MKESVLLIAGCSHAAGSEIDGTEDSTYNRQHSFGNILAEKLGKTPINISACGSTNHTIARSVLNWIYNNNNNDITVIVSWTDSSRVETSFYRPNGHVPLAADWFDSSANDYLRINAGTPIFKEDERSTIEYWQKFIAEHSDWLEIYSLNLILQIQFFLKSLGIKYIMCNAGYMTQLTSRTQQYIKFIDNNHFYNLLDFEQSFWRKFLNQGYKNEKAKYWHHGEEPHKIFAQELENFYRLTYGNNNSF